MKKRVNKISYVGGSLIILLIVSLISPLVMIKTAHAAGIFEPLTVDLSDFTTAANPNMTVEFTIDEGSEGTDQIESGDYILVTLDYNSDQSESIEVTTADIVAADIDLTCGATTGAETNMEDNGGAQPVTVAVTDNTGSADEIKITPAAGGSFCTDASDKYILTITSSTTELVNPTNADTYGVTVGTYTSGDALIDGQSAAVVIGSSTVEITGTVNPTLTLNLRNQGTDNALTNNACALGTIVTGTVSTCDYDVAIATNATSGYSAYIKEDGNLVNANADDIDDVSDNTVTAGNEEYGVATSDSVSGIDQTVASGACSNGSTSAGAALTTSDQLFGDYTGPTSGLQADSNSITTLCHAAGISGTTPAGSYSHTVTITVVGNF